MNVYITGRREGISGGFRCGSKKEVERQSCHPAYYTLCAEHQKPRLQLSKKVYAAIFNPSCELKSVDLGAETRSRRLVGWRLFVLFFAV